MSTCSFVAYFKTPQRGRTFASTQCSSAGLISFCSFVLHLVALIPINTPVTHIRSAWDRLWDSACNCDNDMEIRLSNIVSNGIKLVSYNKASVV